MAMESHPMWVRGLKLFILCRLVVLFMSHPMWVRGLKPAKAHWSNLAGWSHPMWVRGLKRYAIFLAFKRIGVAPYVGAWIET